MNEERFAVYNKKVYSADYVKGKGMLLRSNDVKDISCNGFQRYDGYNKSIVAIKFVDRSEISEFYKIDIIAIYQGYKFEVMEEKENRVSIVTMTGDYRVWLKLGMKCIDKGVYQKWVNRDEVKLETVKKQISY